MLDPNIGAPPRTVDSLMFVPLQSGDWIVRRKSTGSLYRLAIRGFRLPIQVLRYREISEASKRSISLPCRSEIARNIERTRA
jgi:hypothetical protein